MIVTCEDMNQRNLQFSKQHRTRLCIPQEVQRYSGIFAYDQLHEGNLRSTQEQWQQTIDGIHVHTGITSLTGTLKQSILQHGPLEAKPANASQDKWFN